MAKSANGVPRNNPPTLIHAFTRTVSSGERSLPSASATAVGVIADSAVALFAPVTGFVVTLSQLFEFAQVSLQPQGSFAAAPTSFLEAAAALALQASAGGIATLRMADTANLYAHAAVTAIATQLGMNVRGVVVISDALANAKTVIFDRIRVPA